MSYYGGSGGTGGAGSYAARSAAAHAAHSSSMGGSAASAYNSGGTGSTYSSGAVASSTGTAGTAGTAAAPGPSSSRGAGSHQHPHHQESPAELAHQSRLLTDATRRVQEHTYYMNKAMNEDDGLPTVLEHAAMMLSELGDPHSHHRHHHHRDPSHNHPGQLPSSPSSVSSAGAASHLSPKSYYELHMRILNEMPNLEEYFAALSTQTVHSYSLQELYESVQYCPKVVPRLYLQICAGSALISSKTVACKTVLADLIEAVKCVQCPVRGLFLRSYLLQATKDKLPDVPIHAGSDDSNETKEDSKEQDAQTQAEDTLDILSHPVIQTKTETKKEETPLPDDNGTVADAHQFVLKNFIEMNKLWVRVQHIATPSSSSQSSRHDFANTSSSGNKSNREARRRRERERNELRILVGTNLVRLSQLECVTTDMYKEQILPSILKQITSCRDPLAQAYLMDCIIQVFPDEFHIETLQMFLDICPNLRDKVNVRTIVQSIMERLSNYYADEILLLDANNDDNNSEAIQKKENSFQLLNTCIQNIVVSRKSTMPNKEIVRLQMALLKFTLKCYPGNIQHVNQCLASCANSLRQRQMEEQPQTDNAQQQQHPSTPPNLDDTTVDELEKLLSIPLDSLALKVLQINHYSDLLTFLPWDNRRQVAVVMLKAVETSSANLTDLDQIEELFVILTPLILEKGTIDNYTHGMFMKQQALEEQEEALEQQKSQEETMANNHVTAQEHDKRTADLMGALGISSDVRSSTTTTTTTKKATNPLPKLSRPTPPPGGHSSTNNFVVEEQNLVAKLLHLLHHDDDTDIHYKMLLLAKQHVCRGGVTGRLKFTLPPIVLESLKLLKKVRRMEMATATTVVVSNEEETKNKKDETQDEEKAKETDGDDEETKKEKEEKEGEQETTSENKTGEEQDSEEAEEKEEKEKDSEAENKEEAPEKEPAPEVVPPPAFNKKVNCRKIFVFIQKTIAMLSLTDPEAAFKLNLEAAIAADRCAVLSAAAAASTNQSDTTTVTTTDYSAISYEFIAQAFQLYEDEISESKAQQRSIELVVGTLLSCKTFEKDDYEALITKTAQYAAKLLKKPDQCRMVTLCSHLFFTGVDANDKQAYRNPQRVLECLQRALKIADACSMASSANVQLFVEILEHYVYYFEKDNPVISDKFVTGLVALIKEHMESIGFSSSADQMVFAETQGHYRQILRYLQKKKEETDSAKKFANVVC